MARAPHPLALDPSLADPAWQTGAVPNGTVPQDFLDNWYKGTVDTSDDWWEIDLSGLFISSLARVGLAWNVVRITPERQLQKTTKTVAAH